ncbi:MAG: hypothetical protein BWK80_16525 [Desulfobacteraceae bacterium IS3]|nr:MAG: hypothetical protein BWK80_16525 [Desulfobacteraceae bacterium IS3]
MGFPQKMMSKYDKPHPLEEIVLSMAKSGEIVDVSSVSYKLSGGFFVGNQRANKAYRLVAADVLSYMTDQGKLVQHGEWDSKDISKGGPCFSLA